MSDTISREAAIAEISCGGCNGQCADPVNCRMDDVAAIAALPAVVPTVRPLDWKAMFDSAGSATAVSSAYCPVLDKRYYAETPEDKPRIDAKRAARILAALDMAPAPDLTDPVTVHANMLRGTIAKLTIEQIIHLYGVDALCKALAPVIVREAAKPAPDALPSKRTPAYIRPLEWFEPCADCWRADGIDRRYEIIVLADGRFFLTAGPRLLPFGNLAAAKDYAQADHADRILPYVAITPAPAPDADAIREAARQMLTIHDDFMSGRAVDKAIADRLHVAACFGAAAKDACPMEDAAPGAMLRAFLLALIDPADRALDYLRRIPTPAKGGA